MLASAAALVTVVETPGLSQFFGSTPIGPLAWTIVVGSAAVGTLAAVLAPRILHGRPNHAAAAPSRVTSE